MSDAINDKGAKELSDLTPFGLLGTTYVLTQKDRDTVTGEIYTFDPSLLRSAFVASNTVDALAKLNEQLGKKLRAAGIQLKGEIVILPGKPEELRLMQGSEFLATLKQAGCIQEIAGKNPTATMYAAGNTQLTSFRLTGVSLRDSVTLKSPSDKSIPEVPQKPHRGPANK